MVKKKVVPLEKPYEGLYIPNDMWREMYNFSDDAVLMDLASELYDENDWRIVKLSATPLKNRLHMVFCNQGTS